MHNTSWATVCKRGSAEAHHNTKAKNKPQSGEKLLNKEQKELEELEERGSRILLWAAKNRSCKPIVAIVVADMMTMAPNALCMIESKMEEAL
jgi:hypothetical protein